MPTNYSKLTGDLIEARKAAELAALGADTSSINLDILAINLKGARTKTVIEAVKEAGLMTYGHSASSGRGFLIIPPKCGQGISRYRAVQAMYKVMIQAGWNVYIHKQKF